jgi:hypothetical protein
MSDPQAALRAPGRPSSVWHGGREAGSQNLNLEREAGSGIENRRSGP